MIESIDNGFDMGFRPHENHEYIEGLFYSQMESLTRGRRK